MRRLGSRAKGRKLCASAVRARSVGFPKITWSQPLRVFEVAGVVLLMLAAALALMAWVIGLARRLRGDAEDDRQPVSELLTKFRELHGKGVLSDEEFRTIKTKLASQLQDEIRDTDETG